MKQNRDAKMAHTDAISAIFKEELEFMKYLLIAFFSDSFLVQLKF